MSFMRSIPPGTSSDAQALEHQRLILARQVVHHVEDVDGVEGTLEGRGRARRRR